MSKRVVSLVILASLLGASLCGIMVPIMAASLPRYPQWFPEDTHEHQIPQWFPEDLKDRKKEEPIPPEPPKEEEKQSDTITNDKDTEQSKYLASFTFKHTRDDIWELIDESGYFKNFLVGKNEIAHGLFVNIEIDKMFNLYLYGTIQYLDKAKYDYFTIIFHEDVEIPKNLLDYPSESYILIFEL